MLCKICNKEFKGIKSLSAHLNAEHSLGYVDYSKKYENLVPPKCPICKKECKYLHAGKFRITCGNSRCAQILRNQKNSENYKIVSEKRKQTMLARYGVDHPLKLVKFKKKSIQTCKRHYGTEHPIQNKEIKEKIKEHNRKKFGVEWPGQNKDVQDKMKKTNIERYGVDNAFKSKETKKLIKEHWLKKYGVEYPSQVPDIHKKIMSVRRTTNGGYDSKSEKALAELFQKMNISFKKHVNENGHEFDFAVYDDKGALRCFVEVDGEYFHGVYADPDGVHVRGEKDNRRFSAVPRGINFVVIDSNKVNAKNIERILDIAFKNNDVFIREMFERMPIEFPYPSYTTDRMKKDWKHLCNYKWRRGQCFCNSIIHNFHHSIWCRSVEGKISPVDLWKDKNLVYDCIKSKELYESDFSSHSLTDGFELCSRAPKIPILNPSVVRHFLEVNANGHKIVVNNKHGFSEVMLAACSLGMRYVGFSDDPIVVEESNNIINFLQLDAVVRQDDSKGIELDGSEYVWVGMENI